MKGIVSDECRVFSCGLEDVVDGFAFFIWIASLLCLLELYKSKPFLLECGLDSFPEDFLEVSLSADPNKPTGMAF